MKKLLFYLSSLALLLLLVGCEQSGGYAVAGKTTTYSFAYVGNYGSSTLSGYLLTPNGLTRAMITMPTGLNTSNVNQLVISPTQYLMYAVHEGTGDVSTYTIAPLSVASGAARLTAGSSVTTSGNGASSISFTPSRTFAYITNSRLAGNNVSIFSVNSTTGALTAAGTQAARVNPYHSAITPSGEYLYVINYGTSDISAFSINPTTGALSAVSGQPFVTSSGPVMGMINSTGTILYVLCNTQMRVASFTIQSNGALVATTPAFATTGSSPTQMTMHPSGSYLYVANSGSNSISAYAVATDGTLTALSGSPYSTLAAGITEPYAIAADSTGNFLLVTGDASENIGVYRLSSGVPSFVNKLLAGTNPRSVSLIPQTRSE